MTRDECKAKIVERTLEGKPLRSFGLYDALLQTGSFCKECGHNAYRTHTTYESGTKWPNKAMECECGKLKRLWLHNRFVGPCQRCGELPAPIELRTKQHKAMPDGVSLSATEFHTYTKFVCACGMLEPMDPRKSNVKPEQWQIDEWKKRTGRP